MNGLGIRTGVQWLDAVSASKKRDVIAWLKDEIIRLY